MHETDLHLLGEEVEEADRAPQCRTHQQPDLPVEKGLA
jgi:hypothetical protein